MVTALVVLTFQLLSIIFYAITICYYLKEVRAFGGNVKQEHTFHVAIHEVGTGVRIVTVIKMLVTCNIRDLHLHSHERILVVVRRQAHKAVELFLLTSVLRLFEKTSWCLSFLLLNTIGWGSVLDLSNFSCMAMYFSASLSWRNSSFTTVSYCLATSLKSPT